MKYTRLYITILAAGLIAAMFSACNKGGDAPNLLQASESSNEVVEDFINQTLAEQSGEERITYHVGPVDIPAGLVAKTADPLVLNPAW